MTIATAGPSMSEAFSATVRVQFRPAPTPRTVALALAFPSGTRSVSVPLRYVTEDCVPLVETQTVSSAAVETSVTLAALKTSRSSTEPRGVRRARTTDAFAPEPRAETKVNPLSLLARSTFVLSGSLPLTSISSDPLSIAYRTSLSPVVERFASVSAIRATSQAVPPERL